MKHNSLGTNLLKADSQKKVKLGGNPEITEKFLNKVLGEDREGKIPPEGDVTIFHYNDKYHHLNSKYTINRNGEVKSLKGEVMKYFFHPKKRGPRIRIQIEKRDKNGESVFLEKELGILQMMEKLFGRYFLGYKLKCKFPKDYILIPKDGNYENMKYDNLQYIHKNEYYRTKKKVIKYYLSNIDIDNEKVADLVGTTPKYVGKIRQELANDGSLPRYSLYQKLQKELGIEFTEDSMPIYQILKECQGQLSNLEVVKILRPEELSTTKNQRFLTDKVVRVRKKMTDKGLIPRFNEGFESKREVAIQMLKDKTNSNKTNQEIADVLGLKKSQIDNLAKQLKKKENINEYGL